MGIFMHENRFAAWSTVFNAQSTTFFVTDLPTWADRVSNIVTVDFSAESLQSAAKSTATFWGLLPLRTWTRQSLVRYAEGHIGGPYVSANLTRRTCGWWADANTPGAATLCTPFGEIQTIGAGLPHEYRKIYVWEWTVPNLLFLATAIRDPDVDVIHGRTGSIVDSALVRTMTERMDDGVWETLNCGDSFVGQPADKLLRDLRDGWRYRYFRVEAGSAIIEEEEQDKK